MDEYKVYDAVVAKNAFWANVAYDELTAFKTYEAVRAKEALKAFVAYEADVDPEAYDALKAFVAYEALVELEAYDELIELAANEDESELSAYEAVIAFWTYEAVAAYELETAFKIYEAVTALFAHEEVPCSEPVNEGAVIEPEAIVEPDINSGPDFKSTLPHNVCVLPLLAPNRLDPEVNATDEVTNWRYSILAVPVINILEAVILVPGAIFEANEALTACKTYEADWAFKT